MIYILPILQRDSGKCAVEMSLLPILRYPVAETLVVVGWRIIDTRELTKVLREHGVMMGKILFDDEPDNIPEANYEGINFVDQVSCKEIIRYNEGAGKKVVLVDCGVKANIIRCLINRGVEVIRVPWNYDYTDMDLCRWAC